VVLLGFAAGLLPLYAAGFKPRHFELANLDIVFVGLWAIGICLAIATAWLAKYHRLAALVTLGGVGLTVCVTFVWLSAPDLAVTQLLVEIVTTVLILLGLRWLPKRTEGVDEHLSIRARARRLQDFVLAIACGIGMMLIAYAVMTTPVPDAIANYFLANAYVEGGGRNVVNVILVDFRGFDTVGEITVLAIVAITIFALLRRFRPAPDSIEAPAQQIEQNAFDAARADRSVGDTLTDYMLVPSVIMQWLFPVIMLFAAYLFIRGHDLPGGGFAAGIAMACGFLLQYMALGTRAVEDRLRVLPVRWMGAGLLLAVIVGCGSWVFGYPFLTSHSQYLSVPIIGDVPMATALFFDLGVFSLVMGATVLMLIALAHQSTRSLRASRLAAAEREDG
ncbi:MAG: DUF4040 domain-containing protein, partial [Hyphomicrobiales bacterium]